MQIDNKWNTEEVPEHIWSNIEQELDGKKRRAIIWWRIAGVAVIAIGIFTAFNLSKEVNDTENLAKVTKPQTNLNSNKVDKPTLVIDSATVKVKSQTQTMNLVKTVKSKKAIKPKPQVIEPVYYESVEIEMEAPEINHTILADVSEDVELSFSDESVIVSSSDAVEVLEIDEQEINTPGNVKWRAVTAEENIDRSNYQEADYIDELAITTQNLSISGNAGMGTSSTPNKLAVNERTKMKDGDFPFPVDAYYGEEVQRGRDLDIGWRNKKEGSTNEYDGAYREKYNSPRFKNYAENNFKSPAKDPLSTFSVDVDKASLPTFRSYVENNQNAPTDAVRIEEFVNYFNYDYPEPTGEHPIGINTEYGQSPWNKNTKLLKIGLKSKAIKRDESKHSNLVFLIDVSGSMNEQDKLPLLKKSMNLLVDQMEEEDYISIVTYAGADRLVLPATSGIKKNKIKKAIGDLNSGGSTAGARGIETAYEQAQKNYRKGHNNRVILATDGDFNVGISSDEGLKQIIERKRETGVSLSVLGFGDGNFQSTKMETLAQNGNGNFAYLDNIKESEKVLVNEMNGTLETVAKDVKLQVEFNPALVSSYRLIGYENRILRHQDFNNDKIDAGDMGASSVKEDLTVAGFTVTAIYEIIPVGSEDRNADPLNNLKYQQPKKSYDGNITELATVSMRYKKPDTDVSIKVQEVVLNHVTKSSQDFTFMQGVVGFCQVYKDSKYKGDFNVDKALSLLKDGKGKDNEGYRKDFIQLIEKWKKFNRPFSDR